MNKYQETLDFMLKQITKTELSITHAKNKPNVNQTELDNLIKKLNTFTTIKELLEQKLLEFYV